jgi:hypothetical protein
MVVDPKDLFIDANMKNAKQSQLLPVNYIYIKETKSLHTKYFFS